MRGETDLHCGSIDSGDRLPELLRRERFLDMTVGIVPCHGHPQLARDVTTDDFAHAV